jgi:hypothetical protein
MRMRIRVRIRFRIWVRIRIRICIRVRIRICIRVRIRVRMRICIRVRFRVRIRVRIRVSMLVRIRVAEGMAATVGPTGLWAAYLDREWERERGRAARVSSGPGVIAQAMYGQRCSRKPAVRALGTSI